MNGLFYAILEMSISASILVLVVLLLRLILRKAPKWVNVLLWALVAIRLICPFVIESPFSLMPNIDYLAVNEAESYVDMGIDSDIPEYVIGGNQAGDDVPVHPSPTEPITQINRGFSVELILNIIWLSGIAVMLTYMSVSCVCVYRRIQKATQFRDNIYTSTAVTSPFVFGIVKPRIYLPESMDAVSMSYVIAHEEAHVRRRDHWWKPLGFILLAVHWFNPIIWLAYILLCRDIEMACDERVIREMGERERVNYSEALLDCSVDRRIITACPLAFGENNVKERIRTVLNYKKPAFWVVVVAMIACVAVAVCFLTNPAGDMFSGDKTLFIYYEDPAEVLHYPYQLKNDTVVNVKFKTTQSPKTVTLEIFCRKSSVFDEWQKSNIATLKLGETVSFAVPEGHMFKIEASRNSGTNGNVTFDISYGKLNTLGQGENEVQNDNLPSEGTGITLDDVIELSAKGENLTWTDFAGYSHTDIGSGLFIWHLPIDEVFSVKVGGGSVMTLPAFVFLCAGSGEDEERIDIRDGGVEEFVKNMSTKQAGKQIENIIFHSDRGGSAEALEGFYSDEKYDYYFPTIRNYVTIVYYKDGTEQTVKDALAEGKITIADLDRFNIRYYREPKQDYEPSRLLTVAEVSAEALLETEYYEYIHDQNEYTRYILISTAEKITDVRVTDIILDTGMEFGDDLYTLPSLDSNKPLLLGVVFYGDLTSYGVVFKDSDGITHRFIISESGKDGSVAVQEYYFFGDL